MFENPAPYSRVLFGFALACAAVTPFIMCSDAARASPIPTQVDNGVQHNVLRQAYTPYSQHLFTALPLPETGLHTGTHGETDTSRKYKEAVSIIYPPRFTADIFSYNQNIPDNRHTRERTTGAQSGVRSPNTIFNGQSFEGRQSEANHHPFPRVVGQSGNSHYSPQVIVRKSSHSEAASPFHRSSRPPQVWDLGDPQKSSSKEELPGNNPQKVAEDETAWQPSHSSLFSSPAGRYWSTPPPTPRWHYSGYEETNELAAVGLPSTSRRVQSSKFFGLADQTAPRVPSIRKSLDTSVITGNPSPEKVAPSITDFSQGLHSASSIKTPGHRRVQSYLFKDSQTSSDGREKVNTATGDGHRAFSTTPHKQTPSDAHVYGRFSSNFEQSQTAEPTEEVQHLSNNANPPYHNAYVAQYGAQMDSFTKYQHATPETLAQMSVHPAPGSDNAIQSFLSRPHADFQGNFAPGSGHSEKSILVNTTTRGSTAAYTPGETTKSIYGFRGFKNAPLRAVWEPSILSSDGSNERTNSRRYSFDKGKFEIAKIHPSLSAKYSFGRRKASTTLAKLGRTPTDYSSPPPGTSDPFQTTPRPFPSRFKEARPLMPENDVGLDSIPERRQYRIHRRIYGLKGFGTRPLEGAKSSVREPEKSTRVQQGFEGFRQRSSQIWQHRWHNKTEPGSSHLSTPSPTEQNSEGLKSLLKTPGSTEAVTRFTPDKYKNTRKIYTHRGFHPVHKTTGSATTKTHWKYGEQNPATASASPRISSAYPRSAGGLKSEPRPPNKTKPFAMKPSPLNSSTSSTVRGKRVRGKSTSVRKLNESTSPTYGAGNALIVRLPKRPARVKAVMYTDILGSASFSGVRGMTQTPITPADKDNFPNTTARTKQKEAPGDWTLNSEAAVLSRENTSRGPEDEVDFNSVETNKSGVRNEGDDSDMTTSDRFLDQEGSGSGGPDMYDAFSADSTDQDLLELDYLRTSTGNISFTSLQLSPTEK